MGRFVEPSVIAAADDVAALSRLLREDEDDCVRWEAAEALGQLGDPALLSRITDPCFMVRLCAAEALGLM